VNYRKQWAEGGDDVRLTAQYRDFRCTPAYERLISQTRHRGMQQLLNKSDHPSTRRVSEEYLGEVFEGGLGEQLGFAEAGGVILFAANADAKDGVAFEDVEGSDKAADPEGFLA
jgi:hypothetical protein